MKEWERESRIRCKDGFTLPSDKLQYLRDLPVALRHVKINCRFDLERRRVMGTAELTMKPKLAGVDKIQLDSDDTVIEHVRVNGQEAEFEHVGPVLTVHLGEPLRSTDDLVLKIKYASEPRLGLYFTGGDAAYPDKPIQIWTQGQDTDNHHWFPCIDEPRGRVTSEIVCTVPEQWSVVSNGRLVSEEVDSAAGTKTVHWLQDKEHAIYLVTLVAGEFARVIMQAENPLVDFYCRPGREDDARRSFGNTVAMLNFFGELTDTPYPWNKYTQIAVQDFIFGGMENTSATTQTDMTLHDDKAHKDFSSDYLVAHEAAHQWFGDYITCREWAHGWLNEGFATFLEALWQERHLGRDEYVREIVDMQRNYLGEAYRRPIVERKYSDPIDIFDRHLYEKGALVLHMLRNELGQSAFVTAIRHYVHDNANRNVTTTDLQRAVEEATGRNMDWFFDQWVFRAGHPEFKVDYQWNADGSEAKIRVEQTQKGDPFRATTRMRFLFEGRRHEDRDAPIRSKEETFAFRFDTQPKGVQFDIGNGILKTLKFKRPLSMLVFQLQNDDDAAGRMSAADELASEASAEAVRALESALREDRFWGVQSAAAGALGKIRTKQARQALIDNIGVSHLKARRAVANALGEFVGETSARDALIEMLNSEDSYYVSATAAGALGKLRVEGVFEVLKGALERDSHLDSIRSGALAGIAGLNTDEAAEILIEWTRWGRPHRARQAAAAGLKELATGRKKCEERLIELLRDEWFQVKIAAIGAVQHLEMKQAIPELRALANRELDARVKRTAEYAIKSIEKSQATDKRLNKMSDELAGLRKQVAELKEQLGNKQAD